MPASHPKSSRSTLRSEDSMSVADDPKTFGRSRLSFASDDDIDEFAFTLERFERGDLTPNQWRQFRLVRGTCGQRQTDDAQMVRVMIRRDALCGSAHEVPAAPSAQLDAAAKIQDCL